MSASKLEYELKCLNETLGTNLFLTRYQSGYVIFENGNFSSEINYMNEMEQDGLIELKDDGIFLTKIGQDFPQNIMNVFDKYDPPGKSYKESKRFLGKRDRKTI